MEQIRKDLKILDKIKNNKNIEYEKINIHTMTSNNKNDIGIQHNKIKKEN